MESKNSSKTRFYLKWPWNVAVYIVLAVILRVFSIPLILLIMWWNKRQQPNGPAEGYCLQRTRGRLRGLIPAGIFLLVGGIFLCFFFMGLSLPEEVARLNEESRHAYQFSPFLGAGAAAVGLFLAYRSLRDALFPEKSALAQSIRSQLPHPDEAPPVEKLFAMVDQDLRENGEWCGKIGIGKEWVLGDEVSRISRIRGVFGRNERKTSHSGKRTHVTNIYEVWIVDDRQQQQVTSLKSKQELNDALDCLRRRAPSAVFGDYNSKEYADLVYTKDERQQYAQERAYRQRKALQEEQERLKQKHLSQNQVLTLPDGSVTSRVTWDSIRQLLLRPSQTGEAGPFQLVPSVPFQGEGHVFSRLVCLPGGQQELTRIFLEEYSGAPRIPGQYAWIRDVTAGEAEEVLRGWLQGKIPYLGNWVQMERAGLTWQQASARRNISYPPQPHTDWPWILTVGGYTAGTPAWQDIEKELRELNQGEDSFLILEQKDPQNPKDYWFIQCAAVRKGSDQGKYSVEIGASVPGGAQLWERTVPNVQEVIQYFFDAYQKGQVDVSGFRETGF